MKRAHPVGRSHSSTSRESKPRKMRVTSAVQEENEPYPIIKFRNIKVHELTKDYLQSQVSFHKTKIEDKTTASLCLVLYDPNIHFAPREQFDLNNSLRMDAE